MLSVPPQAVGGAAGGAGGGAQAGAVRDAEHQSTDVGEEEVVAEVASKTKVNGMSPENATTRASKSKMSNSRGAPPRRRCNGARTAHADVHAGMWTYSQ